MPEAQNLSRYSVFAGILAAAGLPLYIHAPKFFVDQYDLSLSAVGAALLGLRLLDFVQDPLLGWLIDGLGTWRAAFAGAMVFVLAGAMVALFAVPAPVNPLLWFVGCLAALFTAFSALSILFYARGISKAGDLGQGGHVRLAAWRETGALVGICAAAILPTGFIALGLSAPMGTFAMCFAIAAIVAGWLMRSDWGVARVEHKLHLGTLLKDRVLRRLLYVGLLNAAPAAVSASLFLFFVEYRLGSSTAAGPLLLVFFLAAALSVPFWSARAQSLGVKNTLMWGMVLSIVSFSFAVLLGDGDVAFFALICVASGAALGADMTLLPALFAQRVKRVNGAGGQAFGLWNFCAKFTLALAAATVLPLLDWAGFSANGPNPPEVLSMLTFTYAVVPVALKIIALSVLFGTSFKETSYV